MTPEEILQVEKDIVATLKNIYDPEIPVNIYDLGLIYEIDYEPDGVANIRMTHSNACADAWFNDNNIAHLRC